MKLRDRLNHLDRAFTEMPPQLPDLVESAFMRGDREMKKRYKLMTTLSVAAVAVVLFAAIALAAGRMVTPRTDRIVAAQNRDIDGEGTSNESGNEGGTDVSTDDGGIDAKPTPEAGATPEPTPEPMPEMGDLEVDDAEWDENLPVTPEPTVTPTPMPQYMEGLSIVYTQPQSNYYHSDPGCSGMVGAIEWTEASAISVGKQPCPVCMTGEAVPVDANILTPEPESVEAYVYYTAEGVYYHGDEQCSDMLNAQRHTFAEAEAAGKQRCPDCQPGEPDHYDLFLAAFGQGLEALYPGYVYSYSDFKVDYFDGIPRYVWYVTNGEAELAACSATSFLKEDGVDMDRVTTWAGDANPATAWGDIEDIICFMMTANDYNDLWSFLSDAPQPQRDGIFSEVAEDAADEALREAGVDLSDGALLQSVWAAVDPAGGIVASELCFTDAGRQVAVNEFFRWMGEGYEHTTEVELLSDPDLNASPTSMSGEAQEGTDWQIQMPDNEAERE